MPGVPQPTSVAVANASSSSKAASLAARSSWCTATACSSFDASCVCGRCLCVHDSMCFVHPSSPQVQCRMQLKVEIAVVRYHSPAAPGSACVSLRVPDTPTGSKQCSANCNDLLQATHQLRLFAPLAQQAVLGRHHRLGLGHGPVAIAQRRVRSSDAVLQTRLSSADSVATATATVV